MRACSALPDGYREIFSVDLQKNKKLAVWLNVAAALVFVVMILPMHFHQSVLTLFDMSAGLTAYILRFAVLFVAMIAYIVLHELVHGVTMKLCGTKRVKYGFTGLYAFAGSDDYYDKKSYLTIALAPIVVWGVVLTVVNVLVPSEWFWVVYLIQVFNISGAAGDIYVTCRFLHMPSDILVQDSGVGMTVYSAHQ